MKTPLNFEISKGGKATQEGKNKNIGKNGLLPPCLQVKQV